MNRSHPIPQHRFDALKDSVEHAGYIVTQEAPKAPRYDVAVWCCESGRVVSIPFAGLSYGAAHAKLLSMQLRCSRNAKVMPAGSVTVGQVVEAGWKV